MLGTLRRNRRISAVALTLGSLACAVALAMALAASQARAMTALTCGAQVSSSVTLTSNIGPCPSTTDGLDIVGSNLTVNLNSHSITGTNSTNNTNVQTVGISLMNVHGVTITGPGTIQSFDAGISINGGHSNKITKLTAQNNVAHVEFAGGVDPTNLPATHCDFGDGIVADNSNHNVISNVVTAGNGPFDGIALVDASTYNEVLHSNSFNNNVANIIQTGSAAGQNGPCGPFGGVTVGPGRPTQDIGIRIEGPGATHNVVNGSKATGNMLEGIAIHGYVCPNNPAGVAAGPPNTNNLVEHNVVEQNGFGGPLDGIGVLTQGPPGIVCVAYDNSIVANNSSYNANDGIYLGGRGSHGNVVRSNMTDYNGHDGIELTGPNTTADPPLPGTINSVVGNNEGHGNARDDGADGNPHCDHNTWNGNRFTTFNRSCVMGR